MKKKENLKKQVPKDEIEDVVVQGVERESVKTDDYNVEVIKDYYGKIDPFYLSKSNPEYSYRFLRADDKNLSMKTSNLLFSKGGWKVCQKDHLKKIGIGDRFISPDGHYRVGDTVLAFMPKNLFEEKEEMKKKQANAPMDQVQKLLDGGDPNDPALAGTGHSNMKGLQTKEQLGIK